MSVRVFDRTSGAFQATTLADCVLGTEDEVAWYDLRHPAREEIIALGKRFTFHDLAIEDALKRKQRPKTDFYSDHAFVALYALEPDPVSSDVTEHELAVFVSKRVLLTLHTDPIPEVEVAANRWAEHCRSHTTQSAAMLLYTLVDSIVDGYFPCMDRIAEEVDSLETSLFDGADTENLERIFRMKRALLDLRRVVAPARDVFNSFTRREMPAMGDDSVYYFQDVYDHVIRVVDQIDSQRDVLASAIDVHLSLVSNRMNQTMRTLTAASIVLMSLALIAGIYGMNYKLVPSLHGYSGFMFAIGVMAFLGTGLSLWFRKMGWW